MVNQKNGDKRQRILDAAVQVFAQKGFFHARVSDVADAAGVAGGTIYLYFKNKDDLLINLFEDRMDDILQLLRSELAREACPSDRLRRFIKLHFELVERNPELADVLSVELRQSSKFVREYTPKKFFTYLMVAEEILTEGVETGAFRSDLNPKIFRRALFGALDEVTAMWIHSQDDGRPEVCSLGAAADNIYNIFTTGLNDPCITQRSQS